MSINAHLPPTPGLEVGSVLHLDFQDLVAVSDKSSSPRAIVRFRLENKISSKRLTDYNEGTSIDETYKALAKVIFRGETKYLNCFVDIPKVKNNVVGVAVAEEAYAILMLDDINLLQNADLKVVSVEILERTNFLPDN